MTFYLFNLQLLVTLSQTSYVTVLFVNMVFSDEDKILIKNLYQLKGYNARRLRTEFSNKGWMRSSVNRLLKEFRDTGTVDRCKGSGRPRSARADENIDHVNNIVLSQEDQPWTHSTVHDICRHKNSICSWNVSRGDVHKSWLRRTAPLIFYGRKLCFQKARCSFVYDFLLFFSSERILKMVKISPS